MINECDVLGCDKQASYAVTFTDPAEEVLYCMSCKREKTREMQFEDVEAL